MGSRVDPPTDSMAGLIAQGADAGLPVPDAAEPMVVRSLRIPLRLAEALEAEAASRGLGVTVLKNDQPVRGQSTRGSRPDLGQTA